MKLAAVFGLPRSGTTWISKVIDSHPGVLYFHEPDYLIRVDSVPYVTHREDESVWRPFLKDFLTKLPDCGASRSMLKLPSFKKDFYASPVNKAAWAWHQFKWRRIQVLERFGMRPSVTSVPSLADNAELWLWKSVEQSGNIATWAEAIPEQKIVHVIRHPCGFVDSVLRGERSRRLAGGKPTSEDPGIFDHVCRTKVANQLGYRLTDWSDLKPHERLAVIWLCLNESAIQNHCGLDKVHVISFDDFCISPYEETERLFGFLGIEKRKQTDNFLNQSTNHHSREYFGLQRRSASVPTSWQDRLSDEVIADVMKIVRLGTSIRRYLDLGEKKQAGRV